MQMTSDHPTTAPETDGRLGRAALRAEAWAGEPFLSHDEDPARGSRAGHRAALARSTTALEEIEAGQRSPSSDWRIRFALMLGLERVLTRASAAARLRDGASPPPDRRARGDAHRADRANQRGSRRPERQRHRDGRGARRGRGGGETARRSRPSSTRARAEDGVAEARPGRSPALPLPPSDRVRQDDRRRGLRRGRAHESASSSSRTAACSSPSSRASSTTEGYGDRLVPAIEGGQKPPRDNPDHDPDLRVVRAPRRRRSTPRRLPARHLRRGAHRARREDERRDPQLPRADLHRDDGDRAADREAGLGRLPGLGRRPSARPTPPVAG